MANSIAKDFYLPANNPNFNVTDKQDNGALGKDAFLKILITQLQNQDPTSPMDDKEFIAQMAQFSSLEQMQNMTKAMENLLDMQYQTQLMNYSTFVGKEVKWHELTEEVDENNKPIFNEGTGVIKELKFVDGNAVFILEDGKEITVSNISSILNNNSPEQPTAPAANPLAEASQLIGEKVQYTNGDQVIEAIIEAIRTNNVNIEYILNDGTRLTKDQFTVVENTTETENDEEQETESDSVAE